MIYRSADQARERYELLSTPRAQDVTLGARVDAARCCQNPSCAGKTDAYRTSVNGVDRCNRCKLAWPFFERGSLGVSIRGSAEGIAKRMHAQQLEVAFLGAVLLPRPSVVSARRWAAEHAAWWLVLFSHHGDRSISAGHRTRVADALAVVRKASGTSERTLYTLAREVRDEVESRLARRGMLAA